MDMDLGSFISGQITQIAQSSTSRLGFLALMTTLCDAQGVISDSLTFESLSPVINLAYIKKNCWNPTDPSITFLGPHRTRTRAAAPNTLPLAQPPPQVARHQKPSTSAPPDLHSQMLRSIYQGQQIIVRDLHRLSVHMKMDPPLMTPEAFIQQVAWPGVQPSTDGRGEPSKVRETMAGAKDDIIANLTATDLGPWPDLG